MKTELYTSSPDGSSCSCPIHESGDPPILPLGVDFSHRLEVEEIGKEVAESVYKAHHSYMDSIPSVNICHHGIYLDGHLVGALTYRQPLLNCIGSDTDGRYGLSRRYGGGEVVEINRICVGVPMKNLASASLAASQDKFLEDHADRLETGLLMTFIRIDHTGSMLRALVDKGWHHGGISTAGQAGNRPDKEIREWDKIRWLNELDPADEDTRQASFNKYSRTPVSA